MSERNLRKTRTGKVVSDKMDKTVVVAVVDNVRHPLYKKIVKHTVKFKAHDEENACGIGDTVMIMETRPISKDKRWRVVEIIEKAKYARPGLRGQPRKFCINSVIWNRTVQKGTVRVFERRNAL